VGGWVLSSRLGVYTDLGTKELREMLLNEGQIEYLSKYEKGF
jgi:hypothetical protein